jgi:ribosomal protein S26
MKKEYVVQNCAIHRRHIVLAREERKKKLVSSNKGNRSSWGEGSSLALS